jgi:hypothetical protein
MADELTLPIFHNATLALALMDHANANDDDDAIRAAVDQRDDAREALQKARRAHARAVRLGPAYPKEDLAVLKARVTRAETEADTVSARLRDDADRRLRRARTRREDVLNDALAKPMTLDPVSDRLDRTERLRRLEALDPPERVLMLTTAAKAGTHPELIRAALTAEPPPWPTKSWQPLLPDEAAEEIREWVMARKAPETIADVRAAWRLRRLAYDLDLDRADYPRPPGPPPFDALNARHVRVEREA